VPHLHSDRNLWVKCECPSASVSIIIDEKISTHRLILGVYCCCEITSVVRSWWVTHYVFADAFRWTWRQTMSLLVCYETVLMPAPAWQTLNQWQLTERSVCLATSHCDELRAYFCQNAMQWWLGVARTVLLSLLFIPKHSCWHVLCILTSNFMCCCCSWK